MRERLPRSSVEALDFVCDTLSWVASADLWVVDEYTGEALAFKSKVASHGAVGRFERSIWGSSNERCLISQEDHRDQTEGTVSRSCVYVWSATGGAVDWIPAS